MNMDKQFIAQEIRAQYVEKEVCELDALYTLDRKVKRPANIFAYIFGSLGAVIMGAGMSLVMTDIGATLGIANPMVHGIVIGTVGLIMAVLNYPLYKSILKSRRQKHSKEILELTDKLINN